MTPLTRASSGPSECTALGSEPLAQQARALTAHRDLAARGVLDEQAVGACEGRPQALGEVQVGDGRAMNPQEARWVQPSVELIEGEVDVVLAVGRCREHELVLRPEPENLSALQNVDAVAHAHGEALQVV